jgi:stress-induced morphogen
MITVDAVQTMILAAFPTADVEVSDLTGTSDHFEAVVVAEEFEGKSRIEQHKMVYAALGTHVGNAIHALALRTAVKAKKDTENRA